MNNEIMQKGKYIYIDPHNLQEFLSSNEPEQSWVVDQLIPKNGITLLSGVGGVGKTWVNLVIADAVSNGKPLFDYFTTEKCNTLILDAENNSSVIKSRIKSLGFSDNTSQHIEFNNSIDLLKIEHVREIAQYMNTFSIELLIIDSLIRIHNVDENSASDMSKLHSVFRELNKHGITLLITHHHNKQTRSSSGYSSASVRGSTEIFNQIDSHLELTKSEDLLTFRQKKSRLSENLPEFQVRFDTNNNPFEFMLIKKPVSIEDELITYIKQHPKSTREELISHAQIDYKKLKPILDKLVFSNIIVRKVHKSNKHSYSISSSV